MNIRRIMKQRKRAFFLKDKKLQNFDYFAYKRRRIFLLSFERKPTLDNTTTPPSLSPGTHQLLGSRIFQFRKTPFNHFCKPQLLTTLTLSKPDFPNPILCTGGTVKVGSRLGRPANPKPGEYPVTTSTSGEYPVTTSTPHNYFGE